MPLENRTRDRPRPRIPRPRATRRWPLAIPQSARHGRSERRAAQCPLPTPPRLGSRCLAFLGAGHDHFDGRYRRVVDDGLQFLVRIATSPTANSSPRWPSPRRAHAILQPRHRHAGALRSVRHDRRRSGSAHPPSGRSTIWLGRTATCPAAGDFFPASMPMLGTIGWQLATLRSGQLAGLHVEPQTIDVRRATYLARCREKSRNSQHRQHRGRTRRGTASRAVRRATSGLRPAADQLLAHPPEVRRCTGAGRRHRSARQSRAAIPIIGTTAPRRCSIWAATTGKPGRSSSTRG